MYAGPVRRWGVLFAVTLAGATGWGGSGSFRARGACSGLPTVQSARPWIVSPSGGASLPERAVCAYLGKPQRILRLAHNRVTWLYRGGAAVVLDGHGLIVRVTHVRVIHGEDLGARMTHANCSQAMDDCIVYLTNGRRFRCQGANQHEVDDQISSIIIGRRCTTVG